MLPLFIVRKLCVDLCLAVLATLQQILLLMGRLRLHLSFPVFGKRHVFNPQAILVGLGRIQRRMGVKGIDIDIPGPAPVLFNEVDCLFHAEGGLVVLGRNTHLLSGEAGIGHRRPCGHAGELPAIDFFPLHPVLPQPDLILVAVIGPVVVRVVAVGEIGIAVIRPGLHPALGRGQMQLPCQAAHVALLLEQLGHKFFVLGEFFISVENCFC